MIYVLTGILSYLVGCSNMALYLFRLRKVDARAGGSGNLGASNTVILLGWWAGILVAVHDIGKAALCVWAARTLLPEVPYLGAVAGICAVLGHVFPFYLRFHGGKGFASYLGMTLALNWKLALVVLAVIVAVTLLTDYIVAGTTATITIVPIWMGIVHRSLLLAAILLVGTAVIAYVHRMNYVRIFRGTEIGFRSAARGDHRKA
ncbi:MAG: glycerol-3-phosphate acyltransferase [Firmicutes bacterium]|nr:glycerol-3-phosphate acyltransferase [Bacillota bacterium]